MILITRPLREAINTQKQLIGLGYESVIDPLISFELLYKKISINKKKIFVVSSLQSVRAIAKNKKKYISLLNESSFYVIGNKVASELKKLSSIKIKKVFKDSGCLIIHLKRKNFFDADYQKLHFLTGSKMNQDLYVSLNKLNIKFQKTILYNVVQKNYLSLKTINLLKERRINTIALYSSFTAQTFLKNMVKHGLQKYSGDLIVVCLSKRIKKCVYNVLPFKMVIVSNIPNERSFFTVLKKITKKPKN